jgi:hypothetical protein
LLTVSGTIISLDCYMSHSFSLYVPKIYAEIILFQGFQIFNFELGHSALLM